MANHKATLKDARKNAKRNERNRYYGKTMRNAVRKVLAQESSLEIQTVLPKVLSRVDKLAKSKVIHKNKAARIKSRLMRHMFTNATEIPLVTPQQPSTEV